MRSNNQKAITAFIEMKLNSYVALHGVTSGLKLENRWPSVTIAAAIFFLSYGWCR